MTSWLTRLSSATRMRLRRPSCRGTASGRASKAGAVGAEAASNGRVNQKSEPSPGWLSKPISPPICCTSRWLIARPSPLPP